MVNRRDDAADLPASADISAAWTLDRVGTGKAKVKNARFINLLYETEAAV